MAAGCDRSIALPNSSRTRCRAVIPIVLAGDFNDWGERLGAPISRMGLSRAQCESTPLPRTFPSRVPFFSLDRIYQRGFRCVSCHAPRGTTWARMSDHLPLVAELEIA